jgi:DNA-binding IscR family transcriptional regulator
MFKLSSQGEIALQIILFIKQKKTPLTLEEVAKGIGTSEAFVRKIANRLRKNNILESTR